MSSLYPCTPWPIDPTCCPEWPDDPGEWTDAHREAQWLATIELWRAVAGSIGLCRTVMRPCLDECTSRYGSSGPWMLPYVSGGNWYNNGACGCPGDCTCSRLCTATLQGPVHEVVQVRVDGQVLPPDTWRLLTGDRLARVDGGCWPSCQDLAQPDADGFTVVYHRGVPPGPDAIRAVSMLACRKLDECGNGSGDGCGELPDGVTQVSREGITMRFGDREDEFRSGMRYVDDWVASVNPHGLTEPASVWSPDIPDTLVFYEGPVTLWRFCSISWKTICWRVCVTC